MEICHNHFYCVPADECEEVEREVQTTIATIETVTGESVQQYL